jgi:hypothetical protein
MKVVRSKTFPEATVVPLSAFSVASTSDPMNMSNIAGPSTTNSSDTTAYMLLLQLLAPNPNNSLSQSNDVMNNNNIANNALMSTLATSLLGGISNNNRAVFNQPLQQPPQEQQQQQSLRNFLATTLPTLNSLGGTTNQTQQPQQTVTNIINAQLPKQINNLVAQPPPDANPTISKMSPPVQDNDSAGSGSNPDDVLVEDVDVDFNTLILKAKAAREAAIRSAARVLACRARGNPITHSANVSRGVIFT